MPKNINLNFGPRSQLNGNLIYGDCSAFGRSADIDVSKVLVVPLNVDDDAANKNVVSGVYHDDQNWVDDVHDASIFETTSIDDCLLQVMFMLELFQIVISFGKI